MFVDDLDSLILESTPLVYIPDVEPFSDSPLHSVYIQGMKGGAFRLMFSNNRRTRCPMPDGIIRSWSDKVQISRSVRMPQLHTLLHFHLAPIVIINGSSCRDLILDSRDFCCFMPREDRISVIVSAVFASRIFQGNKNGRALISRWASYLDAFSSYPLRTWLPSVYRGHDNWYTRGASFPILSY